MNDEAEVVAVLGEGAGTFDGGALLDVLEDLRIAGLKAHDQQPAARFLHGLERFAVGGHARRAAPGQAQRLELFAELDGANLLDVEGVVVKEELLHFREILLGPLQLGGHIVGGALAPCVSAERLRPEAESALRRAAARGVERDVGMQQEGHVIAGHIHVALVDLGRPGHGVQVFDLRAVGVVDDLAVLLIADAENLVERLALRKLDDGVIEFAAADEVQRGALVQGLVGGGGNRRTDEGDANRGIGGLDGLGQPLVALPATVEVNRTRNS